MTETVEVGDVWRRPPSRGRAAGRAFRVTDVADGRVYHEPVERAGGGFYRTVRGRRQTIAVSTILRPGAGYRLERRP